MVKNNGCQNIFALRQKVGEIDLLSISPTFFVRFFCTNVLFSSYVLALVPKFRTKKARVNVDEIDGLRQLK